MVGNTSATINPPDTITFEIVVDSDTSLNGNEAEHEVEFELTWRGDETDVDEGEEELENK